MLVAPKLLQKRPDLQNATAFGQPPAAWPPKDWQGELESLAIEGLPMVNEWVFFHKKSATLIATDLAFNMGRDRPFMTRLFVRFTGRLGELAPTVVERLMARDKPALRRSLDQVLEWPFERVVVSHGDILEAEDARAQLAKGFDWLD